MLWLAQRCGEGAVLVVMHKSKALCTGRGSAGGDA